ncbi:MAG: tetratricopeptide repeat protein [Bacteroidota bacterium]
MGKQIIAVILLLAGFCLGNKILGQAPDSSAIAAFFSPGNLGAITDTSKDSLYELTGNNKKLQEAFRFHEAALFLQIGQFDQSQEKAEAGLLALDESFPTYSKAKYYNVIASVYARKQEPKRAIEYFEKALSLSEEADEKVNAALMRSNIANIYFSLVDYESAYKYVSQAYETFQHHPEHPFYGSLLAVLGISESKIGKMKEAKEHGQLALDKAKETNNLIGLILGNLALGEVANSDEQFESAKKYLSSSLEISEKYQQPPFILLNSIGLMAANLGKENFPEAAKFGEKALALVEQGGDQTTVYSVKKNLAEAYHGINQPAKAYRLMRESHELFRDKNSIENKKAINDILLKYDAEKREKELIANRNELLQKKIEQRNLWMILGLLFLLTVGLISALLFIRQANRNRIALLKAEKEKDILKATFEGEEIERERIAYQLHDGVASNLTAARYQLMANQAIPKDAKTQLESILLQAHEDTRRLSHNLAPIYLEKYKFEEALKVYASENSYEKCKVSADIFPKGKQIPKEEATVLYRVAQELTQNALKHAEASEISIQIFIADELTLMVEDNGKGLDFEAEKHKNGISSLLRRAEQLGGSFSIDSHPHQGTTATFLIPLKTYSET